MSAHPVTLWCTLHPAAGKEGECRQVLLDLAAKVHEVESTCLRYEVFEKVENASAPNKVVFYLLEHSFATVCMTLRPSSKPLGPAPVLNDGLLRTGERTPNATRFQNAGGQTDWPFNQNATTPNALFYGTGPKLIPINDEIGKPSLPDGGRSIYCAHGELIDTGRITAMKLGRQLRKLYVEQLNFMPATLDDPAMICLRSTQYQRTFSTMQHVFRGLYPSQFINGHEEDIKVFVADPRDETLLPPEDFDERFAELLQEFTRRAAMKLPNGIPVAVDSKPLKLHGVLDTISAVSATPRPGDYLPAGFLDPKMRVIMEKICAEEEFAGYVYSEEFRSLGVGRILGETIQRMSSVANQVDQVSDRTKAPRMLLFACHDSTIAGMLGSLGAMKDPDWFWPPYTAHITMELFRRVGENAAQCEASIVDGCTWYVRLKYQSQTVTLPCGSGEGNHFPEHQDICTLVSVITTTN
ncbi:acid phosphatase [Colletotrichum nymphaeae SA-01]|uniref:Acid phosphatase n=1 Tax=Colletotrichum nymphaeae SA-01 TaxID=1460502 RepID=A0A135T245_9PEZI|nr:acid phosphatase [Colletotrichum nymphaeae SA-01]